MDGISRVPLLLGIVDPEMRLSRAYCPVVESLQRMELFLNLAWVLLATLMVGLWLRLAPRTGASRPAQFVALAVLLLILFPVISVTDDLQAALNPAEADSFLRRDHACSTPQSVFTSIAGLPLPAFTGDSIGARQAAAPGHLAAPQIVHPALASVQNRPPPSA